MQVRCFLVGHYSESYSTKDLEDKGVNKIRFVTVVSFHLHLQLFDFDFDFFFLKYLMKGGFVLVVLRNGTSHGWYVFGPHPMRAQLPQDRPHGGRPCQWVGGNHRFQELCITTRNTILSRLMFFLWKKNDQDVLLHICLECLSKKKMLSFGGWGCLWCYPCHGYT